MEKKNYFICVDAGGTSTKIAGIYENGTIFYNNIFPGGSPAVDHLLALKHIKEGIQKAYEDISVDSNNKLVFIQMGISGWSVIPNIKELENEYGNIYNCQVSMVSDAVEGLYSIIENKYKTGILVLAGTGMAIYGINHGINFLIGGWGHLLGEKGSSYSLVHKSALKIIEHFEKGINYTAFDKEMLKVFNAQDAYGIKPFFYNSTKAEVASLAIKVKELAMSDNALIKSQALQMLYNEGVYLAMQVIDLANRLNIENGAILGLKGGLFKNGQEVIEGLNDTLRLYDREFKIIDNDTDPMMGCYYLAKETYSVK